MPRYTGNHVQQGNTCAASTLMIAMHEANAANPVSHPTEQSIYQHTRDPGIRQQFGQPPAAANSLEDYSSPIKVRAYARLGSFPSATIYKHSGISINTLTQDPLERGALQALLRDFVDQGGAAAQKTTDELKALLDDGPLQINVYTGGVVADMHALLLRKDGNSNYIYDTAYGCDFLVNVDDVLTFNHGFNTPAQGQQAGRLNNFLGIVVHLKA